MKKILCLLAIAVLIFTLAVPALAVDDAESLGIPEIAPLWTDTITYPYALVVSYDDSYKVYFLKKMPYPDSDDDSKFWSGGGSLSYRLRDGEWIGATSSNSATGLYWSDLVWCSTDLIYDNVTYYVHDPNFFPIPLWAEMAQVTQGEITGLLQNLGGTLKVLVLCGVGCLALLAVLSLFGKRSLIFRH